MTGKVCPIYMKEGFEYMNYEMQLDDGVSKINSLWIYPSFREEDGRIFAPEEQFKIIISLYYNEHKLDEYVILDKLALVFRNPWVKSNFEVNEIIKDNEIVLEIKTPEHLQNITKGESVQKVRNIPITIHLCTTVATLTKFTLMRPINEGYSLILLYYKAEAPIMANDIIWNELEHLQEDMRESQYQVKKSRKSFTEVSEKKEEDLGIRFRDTGISQYLPRSRFQKVERKGLSTSLYGPHVRKLIARAQHELPTPIQGPSFLEFTYKELIANSISNFKDDIDACDKFHTKYKIDPDASAYYLEK
ncbi:hypothetical protein KGF57_002006 [Candida theae]|uniref:Uncharacterized protein n=1 Tax=Candida theae TaxID=1198502 RepID=A0AAD5FZ61_9ASCO|nr:uncharacterized protein KGF57_002006 [Candida theae]KAI5960006.1 hypothetical protein KGF57_002006 [Candida theae]